MRTTFQEDYVAYCLHYEQYGQAEGRNAIELLHTDPSSTIATGSILGSYATSYNPNIQRAINVELAANRINGVTLEPGQEFSFSQTILPRTPENGYVTAPVINAGTMTTGYGGGICQVSSTLYAAMIVSGLPATERHPHSLPVSYIPEGWDATISTPYKDLKFINIFDFPIQINATTDTAFAHTNSLRGGLLHKSTTIAHTRYAIANILRCSHTLSFTEPIRAPSTVLPDKG